MKRRDGSKPRSLQRSLVTDLLTVTRQVTPPLTVTLRLCLLGQGKGERLINQTVGVILKDFGALSCRQMWEGIHEELLRMGGLNLSVCQEATADHELCLRKLHDAGANGLILCGVASSNQFGGGVPTVSIPAPNAPFRGIDLLMDPEVAASLAIQHLRALGHKRLAFVQSTESHFASAEGRMALHAATRRSGYFAGDLTWVTKAPYAASSSPEECPRAFMDALEGSKAVLCSDDDTALSVIALAKRLGMRCPSDISVMSCGDGTSAAPFGELTSIQHPWKALGKMAGQKLLNKLTPKPLVLPASVMLHSRVQIGQTVTRSAA